MKIKGISKEKRDTVHAHAQERAAINARFAELDQARARPLAAYALGRQTPADTARLTEIEDEADRLRARLEELKAEEKDSIEAQEEPVKG